jgi:hypothetical protein
MTDYTFSGPITGAGHNFGPNGRIVHNHKAADPQALARTLIQEIQAAQSLLPPDLIETAEQVAAELAASPPDRPRLRRLLAHITLTATGITAVAAAADQLTTLLDHL